MCRKEVAPGEGSPLCTPSLRATLSASRRETKARGEAQAPRRADAGTGQLAARPGAESGPHPRPADQEMGDAAEGAWLLGASLGSRVLGPAASVSRHHGVRPDPPPPPRPPREGAGQSSEAATGPTCGPDRGAAVPDCHRELAVPATAPGVQSRKAALVLALGSKAKPRAEAGLRVCLLLRPSPCQSQTEEGSAGRIQNPEPRTQRQGRETARGALGPGQQGAVALHAGQARTRGLSLP